MDMHYCEKKPSIHPSVFIAPGSVVTGDVAIGERASVWFLAVLRGDLNYIRIGERTNIQDGCIIHVDHEHPCIVANDVTVGHRALLHGCTVEEGCLIGMGAVILNGAVVKKGSIIAAGAVVKEGTVVEQHSLMAGVPAKKIREDGTLITSILHHAQEYALLAQAYKNRGNRDR